MKSIIVRSPNWLGDCVMAIPAIKALREKFTDAKIYVQAKKSVAIIYEWLDCVDEILIFPEGKGYENLGQKWRNANDLAQKSFDLGILFTNSFSTAFWMWKSAVTKIIGTDVNLRGMFLTDRVALTNEIRESHQAEWYLALLKPLGIDKKMSNPVLGKNLSDKEKEFLNKYEKPYVVIAPGSAYGPAKDWLAENFAKVASSLHNEKGFEIIITGSKKDRQSAQKICEDSGVKIHNLAGETSMNEFILLVSKAAAFIGNDSGASHVAAALGIPSVAIFGSTRPDRTRPLGERVVYLTSDVECVPCLKRVCPKSGAENMACMKSITSDMVLKTLEKFNFKCCSNNAGGDAV